MTEIPEQSGGSSPASIPVKDRRLHVRQRVSSLTYVDLGEDNGGIVLNVSEAGIRIQAAAGLEEGPVSIRLQLPGTRKRLEVSAEVVWVGQSRKEAGLRFVDLSEEARRQIGNWIAQEASPGAPVEEDESESIGEPTQAATILAEEVPAESASAAVQQPVADDELAFDDDFASEQETALESAKKAEELDAEQSDDAAVEASEAAAVLEAPEEKVEASPAPAKASTPIAAPTAKPEPPRVQIPEVRKTEPEPAIVEESVPIPANTPEPPVSVFSGISGTHGAPSMGLGFSSSARIAPRTSPIGGDAPLFVRPHRPAQAADDDGSKSYRVKLQSGWFVAALVLLLALISFVAGMAVRRGALNSVIGQSDEPVHPQAAPPLATANPQGASSSDVLAGAPAEAPAKPLEIEVVDSSGRRWEIPAGSGTNHTDTSGTHTPPEIEASPPVTDGTANSRKSAGSQRSDQDTSSVAVGADKTGAPLMLTLPETPISASGSVAIRSRGEVPVPAGAAKSAQEGRNLQIGQLTNLVEPVYPPDALQHRIEGTVKLHVVIGVDGAIKSLEPRSGPELLIQAAMTAVRDWKYNPTTLNGKPIETQEDVSFVFRLPK